MTVRTKPKNRVKNIIKTNDKINKGNSHLYYIISGNNLKKFSIGIHYWWVVVDQVCVRGGREGTKNERMTSSQTRLHSWFETHPSHCFCVSEAIMEGRKTFYLTTDFIYANMTSDIVLGTVATSCTFISD